MASVMKTPGVYIVEKSAFPSSVVEVATAVPAFIGYTEQAFNKDKPLTGKPRRITSMEEYRVFFGGAPPLTYTLTDTAPTAPPLAIASTKQGDAEFHLVPKSQKYLLYYDLLLFYQNGGGPCYIVSVGSYEDKPDIDKLQGGIKPLIKEQEPTMVVIPDAVLLSLDGCASVQQAAISHCGKMQSRVAILDVHEGYKERSLDEKDCVSLFRNKLGVNDLGYAAAYYPWLDTSVVQDSALSYQNFDDEGRAMLQTLMRNELGIGESPEGKQAQQAERINKLDGQNWDEDEQKEIEANEVLLNKSLIAMSPAFNDLLASIKEDVNLLPPSGALAGIYTMVDNTRGVWKAPANVSIAGVVQPAANISHDEQEDLNVTPQGKSVNAIRAFIGEGTLVWGARTLDGNSLDWRYVNVRRTMIMLEQSIKLATKAYVFEPNNANTWVTIKSMIRNFLTGIWRRGGLAGASPDDAFSVHVGIGESMTSVDILEGILRVTVLVAVSRPAEFIEITFQQQMQKS